MATIPVHRCSSPVPSRAVVSGTPLRRISDACAGDTSVRTNRPSSVNSRSPARSREPLFTASFNVAPTQLVPVIRMHGGQRELVRMRFGLIPFFAKGDPGQYSTINARVETVRTSPAYRTAWKRGQRCLVIANGFYEWQVIADGKQPWFISCADQPIFGFAGLWDQSTPGRWRAHPVLHHHHAAGLAIHGADPQHEIAGAGHPAAQGPRGLAFAERQTRPLPAWRRIRMNCALPGRCRSA